MSDLDKAELRRLAEAASHKDWYAGNAFDKSFILKYQIITDTPDGKYVLLDGNQNFREDCVANVAFVGAANPAAVLTLLGENAQLRAEVEALRVLLVKAHGRMAEAKICFDRDYPDGWSGELHLAVAMREIGNAIAKEGSANG